MARKRQPPAPKKPDELEAEVRALMEQRLGDEKSPEKLCAAVRLRGDEELYFALYRRMAPQTTWENDAAAVAKDTIYHVPVGPRPCEQGAWINKLQHLALQIIRAEGFEVNPDKTRLFRSGSWHTCVANKPTWPCSTRNKHFG
ncbi:MAG TPA: hypothetical protein VH592_01990 [Gemmataceae bacterium]|jgi:hypothetical protein